jgi:hypothetical protein
VFLLSGISFIASPDDPLWNHAFNLALGDSVVASILGLIATVAGLFETARLRQWGWFVVFLLLNGVGALIYTALGPGRFETR